MYCVINKPLPRPRLIESSVYGALVQSARSVRPSGQIDLSWVHQVADQVANLVLRQGRQ